jgi:hypothetical protein
VLEDGRLAAQGPIGQVMMDRVTLLGIALRETHPELAGQPLPATQEELIHIIHQFRLVSAV